jgi:transporter family-2 protein
MMDTVRHAALMIAAGLGIPVLAALNARLGQGLGSTAAAAVMLFAVALAASTAAALLAGAAPAFGRVAAQPPLLFLGGALVAFYIFAVTLTAPRFGVGNTILCVLLGQMIAAAAIDHFGLFGAAQQSIGPHRAAGLAIMAAGLVLARAS